MSEQIPIGTAEDLTGKHFGKLTVLYRVRNTGATRGAKWKCLCSCGNTVEVLAANLKRNHTLSCGCLQKEKTSESRFINEIGNKYGRLIVIERGEDYISPSKVHRVTWKCKCECGNIVIVDANSLRSGKTLSCGCYRAEQVSNRCNDNYIGKTFHHITILDKTLEKNNSGETLWKCKCNLCNNEFLLSTGKLKTQVSCGCAKDSYGVFIITTLLNNHNIKFEREKTFDNCVFENSGKKARFDFYIDNKYIIEFDGQQHFSYSGGWNTEEQMLQTQQRDKFKNTWCHKNKIPIIRIPFWEINNLTIEDLSINSKFLIGGYIENGEDN